MLDSVDAGELYELFAYFILQQELEAEERGHATPPPPIQGRTRVTGPTTDAALKNIFGETE